MVFLDPFKDLLLDYTSCCRHEGLPASQNILDNYQHKALVPQGAWYVLYPQLDSELKAAAFWGQQDIFKSALFSGSDPCWEKRSTRGCREETASLPHGWPFYLVSTDHCRNTAEDRAKLAWILVVVGWLSSLGWKVLLSLNHPPSHQPIQDTTIKVWYYLKFAILCFATQMFSAYRIQISCEEMW